MLLGTVDNMYYNMAYDCVLSASITSVIIGKHSFVYLSYLSVYHVIPVMDRNSNKILGASLETSLIT